MGTKCRCAARTLVAVVLAFLAVGSPAAADTFAVGPWTLYESYGTYSTYYETTSDDRFRWITDNAHSSRLSINDPYDGYPVRIIDFPAHYTSYIYFDCHCSNYVRMQLRGRSLYGTQYDRYGNFIL